MEELRRLKRRLLMVLSGLFFTFLPLFSPGDAHVLGFLAVLPGVWELREAAAGGQKLFSKPKKRKKRKRRR